MFWPFRPSRPSPAPASDAGARGEDLAAAAAVRRGWRVLARNYRCRVGELDLILRAGRALVFVEVKTRRRAGLGLEAVTWTKRRRVVRAALDYAGRERVDLGRVPLRFDVCEVVLVPGAAPVLTWHEDAFDVEDLGLDL
ncbi:MAG: YraN family protein [Planctomycetota bacterium]